MLETLSRGVQVTPYEWFPFLAEMVRHIRRFRRLQNMSYIPLSKAIAESKPRERLYSSVRILLFIMF